MEKEAKIRSNAQREVMLTALREAGDKGVLNSKLKEISNNYTSRTAELAKSGYIIDCLNLGGGLYKYILRYEPKIPRVQQRAIEMFWDILENEYNGIANKEVLEEIFHKYNLNVVRNWGANRQKKKIA